MIPRSYLYVPGDARAKLAKALERGADALILDLEDAVPASGKDAARTAVAAWLNEQPPEGTAGVQIWVRINPGELGHLDVFEVACPALHGVMVAKTESAAELESLDDALDQRERELGMDPGTLRVVPLLESAAAVLDARQIASAPRVERLQVGEADLAGDTGITAGPDEREWAVIRSLSVLVSAAAGISPPVAPVSTNFRDLDGLADSTRALARQGFLGRACIHPAQVAIVNEVFTPADDQVHAARQLVADFDAAVAAGRGVLVDPEGHMVDEAVVRRARRVLALAR